VTARIEEPLPEDPTEAEAVLHVRRQLRRQVRAGESVERQRALAFLFGLPDSDGARFRRAAESERPIAAAAELMVDAHGVATLGHDVAHVERCRTWLLAEKAAEPAYNSILAFDLATLLALSRARLLARAGNGGERPPVPILIRGETGTGKELLALAIHRMSGRKGDAPVAVHVAGMPKDQIADEIFGHTRGAFTGAIESREGLLHEADGGTFHLDEVGDLPAEAQVRLLRVLQDGHYSRLGENRLRRANVRVLAATWHDLSKDIEAGTFRQDLYHRICAGEVVLPPLRARLLEFSQVVDGMLVRLGEKRALVRSARDALAAYPWPGNLRELENALRVAVSGSSDGVIRLEDLPPGVQAHYLRQPVDRRCPGVLCDDPDGGTVPGELVPSRVATVEAMIAADTPEQEIPKPTAAFLRAMDGLPDASGGHEEVLQSIRAVVELRRVGKREGIVAGRLAGVAMAPELPEAVRVAVRAAADAHAAAGRSNLDAAERANERVDLRQSPWGRLYLELTELPILRGEDHVKVLGFVTVVVQLAYTIDPGFVDRVRQILKAGGINAIREWARRSFVEATSGEDDELEEAEEVGPSRPPGHPRSWTRDQWTALVEAAESMRNLEAITGLSAKTINGHLDRVGVFPPWSRRRPDGAP
jgi:hypothetical protein